MGTVSAAAEWTAEDDVLLKNAVEVIHHAARPDPSIPLPYPQQLPPNAPPGAPRAAGAEFRRSSSRFHPGPAAAWRWAWLVASVAFDSRLGPVGIAVNFGVRLVGGGRCWSVVRAVLEELIARRK